MLFDDTSPVASLMRQANEVRLFAEAVAFKESIQAHWRPLFKRYERAREACLIVFAVTTIVLLLGSGDWAETKADPRLAWGTILLGFTPAGWLYWLSRKVELFRIRADVLRRELEVKVAQALEDPFHP